MITLLIIALVIIVIALTISLAAGVIGILWTLAPVIIVAWIIKKIFFDKRKEINNAFRFNFNYRRYNPTL